VIAARADNQVFSAVTVFPSGHVFPWEEPAKARQTMPAAG